MPKMRIESLGNDSEKPGRKFKVKSTGFIGLAVGREGRGASPHRHAAIGSRENVLLIDLLDEETGEVRTFEATFLEEQAPQEG